MAARRTLEWIGMFKGLAGFLDMKYQTCFSKAVMQNLVRKPAYAASCGASKSVGKLMHPRIHHIPTTYTNDYRCYNHSKSSHLATPTSVGSPSGEETQLTETTLFNRPSCKGNCSHPVNTVEPINK